jgi:hypothetical protein
MQKALGFVPSTTKTQTMITRSKRTITKTVICRTQLKIIIRKGWKFISEVEQLASLCETLELILCTTKTKTKPKKAIKRNAKIKIIIQSY